MIVLLLTLATLVIGWLYYRIQNRRVYELAAKVPGLPELPIIGNAHHFLQFKVVGIRLNKIKKLGEMCLINNGVSKVWLGPKLFFVVASPELAEIVLNSCLTKGNSYKFLEPLFGKSLITTSEVAWKRNRKIMSPAFSMKALQLFIDKFSKDSEKMSKEMEEMAGKGEFDVQDYIKKLYFNVIGETVVGVNSEIPRSFGDKYIKGLKNALDICFSRVYKPWLHPDGIFNFFYKIHEDFQAMQDSTRYIVSDKKKNYIKKKQSAEQGISNNNYEGEKVKSNNFVDMLFEHSERDPSITDELIEDEVRFMLAGGLNPASVTLSNALMVIGTYPEVQRKLQEELKTLYGDSDRSVTKEDLAGLQYLDCFLKETLRVFTTAPFLSRKVTQETKVGDFTLPANTECLISTYLIHNDVRIWGPDVDLFKPERWLLENAVPRHPYSYMPFSRGSRNCLGNQFAMLSMKTFLAVFLRKFNVKADINQKEFSIGVTIIMVGGYPIAIERRNPAEEMKNHKDLLTDLVLKNIIDTELLGSNLFMSA